MAEKKAVKEKAKKTYQERFYSLPEEELQILIKRAQKGNGPAQLQLLEVFANFLSTYIKLLHTGAYDLSNYNTRRFLALFVKETGLRYCLLRNKLNPTGMRQLNEVIRGITVMTKRYGDLEDIEQTVHLAFLESLAIYKPKESSDGPVPFSGFINSYFYYVLKKKVDALLIDQLGRKTFPLIDYDEVEGEDGETPPGFVAPPEPSAEDMSGWDDIDEFWVAGDSAKGVFATLTMQERQLLRWRYYNNERSSDIAHRVTEHSNTSRENIAKIKQKIQDYLDNLDT